MPLSEKWVITLSTQFGCVMECNFCDVPKVKYRGNATYSDLYKQFMLAVGVFPSIKYTERLNIHFARMGEPIFNDAVIDFARDLGGVSLKETLAKQYGLRVEVIHPVLTTSCPKGYKRLKEKLLSWAILKNTLYRGQAGLQLSINSTSQVQRDEMFGGDAIDLTSLAEICRDLPDPLGRKYCLNFAYSSDFEVDGKAIVDLFPPDRFMCKITPIHNNRACRENGIKTDNGYVSYLSYVGPEESLKEAGYDVLVFIPSMDEEQGLVTCGNAVLSGSEVKIDSSSKALGIEGLTTLV
jgi:23S rRNA (adenine2503-C2)-methyltransferase